MVCTDRDTGRLVVLDASGKQRSSGPEAPAGALTSGDLNGDGKPEVVFLDSRNRLAAFSGQGRVLDFSESIRPLAPSAVAVVDFDREVASQVVYIDSNAHLRIAHLSGPGRPLTDLASAVAMAPALEVDDFDGDGHQEVCYLRRRLWFGYPGAELSLIDKNGDHRELPLSSDLNAISAVTPNAPIFASDAAPLGPRATGQMFFPTGDSVPS